MSAFGSAAGVDALAAVVAGGSAVGAVVAGEAARRAGSRRVESAGRSAAGADRRARRWGPFRSRRRRRVAAELDRMLPVLAESMARELRTGVTLLTALESASATVGGVVERDVSVVVQQLRAGRPADVVLGAWEGHRRSPAVGQLVAMVLLGLELGGELAGAFELGASGLRDQQELRDEIGALTSQSRASARLLTGLPVLAVAGSAAIDPATGRFLLGSPAGWACALVAVAADVVGWWWMRSLMRGVA